MSKTKLGKWGKKAFDDSIVIAKWAKSCETEEQFENVERFTQKHGFESNVHERVDVNYYIGFLHGFIISLRKTKFNQE